MKHLYLDQYKGSITQNLGRLKDWLDQMSRTQCAFANSNIQASRKKIGFELAIVIVIDTLRRKYTSSYGI